MRVPANISYRPAPHRTLACIVPAGQGLKKFSRHWRTPRTSATRRPECEHVFLFRSSTNLEAAQEKPRAGGRELALARRPLTGMGRCRLKLFELEMSQPAPGQRFLAGTHLNLAFAYSSEARAVARIKKQNYLPNWQHGDVLVR
ncbi:hypothetical protein [Kamptonema formosum]|uniref:hypothetical protein n=1 Tax=Kamptonema formosum TaxID=331992 RepID=UPI00034B2D0B|nr:hypothetical protein [Oscillatoria sp. PCC 10802]